MNRNGHTVKEHFENRAPEVKAIYLAILKASKQFAEPAEKSGYAHCRARGKANKSRIIFIKGEIYVSNTNIIHRD